MTDGEAIRELVALAATLERPLAAWIASAVWRGLPASRRRAVRDDLLRAAAQRLPPGSAWQKSHALADLARRPGRPGVHSAAELVALAREIYAVGARGRTITAGQIFRVLATRILGVEMRVDEVAESNPVLDLLEKELINE